MLGKVPKIGVQTICATHVWEASHARRGSAHACQDFTLQILTVSVNYSSIKRPIINFVQLIEAVVRDGLRHCYSNYLKNPISNVLSSKETTPIS